MKRRISANLLTLWLAVLPGALPAQAGVVKAIEYAGDHMFLTANPAEIAALDSGAIPGWVRTGVEFWVHDAPDEPSLVPVCRFYSAAFAPRSSHFYTADAAECAAVQGNPDWVYEGTAFYARPPEIGLAGYPLYGCPIGWKGVARWYNNGWNGVPIHLYWFYGESYLAPYGWTLERYLDNPAFCIWRQSDSSSRAAVDLNRAWEGLQALTIDSTWELVLDPGGSREAVTQVTFNDQWLVQFGGTIVRTLNIRPVSSNMLLSETVYNWIVRWDAQYILVLHEAPLPTPPLGAQRIFSLFLFFVGRDHMEGEACLSYADGVGQVTERCGFALMGRRL